MSVQEQVEKLGQALDADDEKAGKDAVLRLLECALHDLHRIAEALQRIEAKMEGRTG